MIARFNDRFFPLLFFSWLCVAVKAFQLWLSNATVMYRFAHLFAAGRRGDWNERICWFTRTVRRQQLIGFEIQWLVNIVFLKVNWLRKQAAFRNEHAGGYSLLGSGGVLVWLLQRGSANLESQVLQKWSTWERGAGELLLQVVWLLWQRDKKTWGPSLACSSSGISVMAFFWFLLSQGF